MIYTHSSLHTVQQMIYTYIIVRPTGVHMCTQVPGTRTNAHTHTDDRYMP
jgi:hypothetical protein